MGEFFFPEAYYNLMTNSARALDVVLVVILYLSWSIFGATSRIELFLNTPCEIQNKTELCQDGNLSLGKYPGKISSQFSQQMEQILNAK